MLYLTDKAKDIKIYTLPGIPQELAHAKVISQVWKGKYIYPTLAYIEVHHELRHSGYGYRLLDLATKENPYLWFRNFNPNFWERMSKKKNLPYEIKLVGMVRGEIIRKCNCCALNHLLNK